MHFQRFENGKKIDKIVFEGTSIGEGEAMSNKHALHHFQKVKICISVYGKFEKFCEVLRIYDIFWKSHDVPSEISGHQ